MDPTSPRIQTRRGKANDEDIINRFSYEKEQTVNLEDCATGTSTGGFLPEKTQEEALRDVNVSAWKSGAQTTCKRRRGQTQSGSTDQDSPPPTLHPPLPPSGGDDGIVVIPHRQRHYSSSSDGRVASPSLPAQAILSPPLGQFLINTLLQMAALTAAIAFGVYAVKSVGLDAFSNQYSAQAVEQALIANQVAMLAVCLSNGNATGDISTICSSILDSAGSVLPSAASSLFMIRPTSTSTSTPGSVPTPSPSTDPSSGTGVIPNRIKVAVGLGVSLGVILTAICICSALSCIVTSVLLTASTSAVDLYLMLNEDPGYGLLPQVHGAADGPFAQFIEGLEWDDAKSAECHTYPQGWPVERRFGFKKALFTDLLSDSYGEGFFEPQPLLRDGDSCVGYHVPIAHLDDDDPVHLVEAADYSDQDLPRHQGAQEPRFFGIQWIDQLDTDASSSTSSSGPTDVSIKSEAVTEEVGSAPGHPRSGTWKSKRNTRKRWMRKRAAPPPKIVVRDGERKVVYRPQTANSSLYLDHEGNELDSNLWTIT
ncbi:MAG: hypothetical protein M1833_003094 [Piccolia ochrophora]|nr:MAG: hypothetical protein M1833_003094 [Piccolia ochrophora]